MKIIRNGVEIELTEEELEVAYREAKLEYAKLDLIHKIKEIVDDDTYYEDKVIIGDEQEFEIGRRVISGEQLKKLLGDKAWMDHLVYLFDDALGNTDCYWESYWEVAEAVIEDEINDAVPKSEKELKQEANREKYQKLISDIWASPMEQKTKIDIIGKLVNEGV